MPDDYAVTVINQYDEQRLAAGGQLQTSAVAMFMVGRFGPYTVRVVKGEQWAFELRTAIERTVADVRQVVG